MSICGKSRLDYDPCLYSLVFCSLCLKSIFPCLALLEEMFQVALSSFSHLTFRAADIMSEKIFCKSMRKALFINPLFVSDTIYLPLPLVFALFLLSVLSCIFQACIIKAMISEETRGITLHFANWLNLKRPDMSLVLVISLMKKRFNLCQFI